MTPAGSAKRKLDPAKRPTRTAAQEAYRKRQMQIVEDLARRKEDTVRRMMKAMEDLRDDLVPKIGATEFEVARLHAMRRAIDDRLVALGDELEGLMMAAGKQAGKDAVRLAVDPLLEIVDPKSNLGGKLRNAVTVDEKLLEAATRSSADLVQIDAGKGLAAQIRAKLNELITAGTVDAGGVGRHKIMEAVTDLLGREAFWKGERIVRTEIGMIQEIATQGARESLVQQPGLGAMKKRWLEGVSRPNHRQLARSRKAIVPAMNRFYVPADRGRGLWGEWAMFPRDPGLTAANRVNCACASVDHVDDEVMSELFIF